jgi:hypothetical protein
MGTAKTATPAATKTKETTAPTTTTTTTEETKDRGKAGLLEYLRYAPAAMNALQLAQLKKPDQVGLNRLNNRYIPQRVDERGIQNTVQDSISNNRDAILGSSGGSGSAARSNLLASQRIGGDAMSKAYQAATEANRQDNRLGQQFNLGVDTVNLKQANQETGLNLEQQAAYRTNKSKLMSQLGNDLGNVGREELYKRYPEMMGLDYRWRGNYDPTKKGTTTTTNEGNTSTTTVNTTTNSGTPAVDTVTMNRPGAVVENPNNNTQSNEFRRFGMDENGLYGMDENSVYSKTGYSDLMNKNRKGGYLSKNAKLGKMVLDPIPNMVKKKKKKAGRKTAKKKY